MYPQELSVACPGVDFSNPYQPYDTSFSIGDYVVKYLQKTFSIIKSSPTLKNEVIVEFVKAGFTDNRLPYSKALLIENLGCSNLEADDFLLAQSTFFAVSFEPHEARKRSVGCQLIASHL